MVSVGAALIASAAPQLKPIALGGDAREEKTMESVLVKKNLKSIQECLNWANEMIGGEIPGYDWLIADAISHFQIIMHNGKSYTIIVLVRATGKAA